MDLDDTLVTFDAVTEISWKQVCAEYCTGRDGLDPEVVRTAIKKISDWYWGDTERHRVGRNNLVVARRAIVSMAFEELNLPESDAISVADEYSAIRLENMYVVPEAIPMLQKLKGRSFPIGLITNGDAPTQNQKIDRFGLRGFFDFILIEGDLGFGKPDPRIFNHALEIIGKEPEQTMMIGDNLVWDVSAPQSRGIIGVWYDYRGNGISPESKVRPDMIISSLSRISDMLEEI